MGMSTYVVLLGALAWTSRARFLARDSRDPHSAFNIFNWAYNLASHQDGTFLRGKNNQIYESNLVTDCPPNVVFVLDGSDSVPPIGYRFAKEAVVREIRAVTQTFANTDVGVILFSDIIEELPLEHRTSAQIDDFTKQVLALRQPRRHTSMSTALRNARETLLDYSVREARAYNGDKSGNIIVLLSDGIPDDDRETLQLDQYPLTIHHKEAKIAREKDVFIISLSLEKAELQLLNDISQVVQDIRTTINWTSVIACPATVLDRIPKGSHCQDFLMVVDGSDSVLHHKETVRQYLAYTALRYQLVTNAIGVNVYGTDSHIQAPDTRIRLKDNKYDLADKIRHKLMFPTSGGTGTDRAIIQTVDILSEGHRDRHAALVIITDGPTLDPQATRDAIHRSRDRGYPVIIIRVGSALTDEELNFISSGERTNVFSVDNFTQLFGVNIDESLCNTIAEPNCSNSCQRNRTLETCRCGCVNDCPPGQVSDIGRSCRCICANVCPEGQLADPNDHCNCICSTRCANGNRASITDRCACRSCSSTCPAGQIPDPSNNCRCVCTLRCSDGQLASITNNCRCSLCSNICPAGQYSDPNNNCNCVCTNTCSNGHLASLNNNCICETICSNRCPEGLSPDPRSTCRCACTNTCGRGQFPDISEGCRCSCSNPCPMGQTADPNNNCECQCGNSCPEGQLPNPEDGCMCYCSDRCPPGQSPSKRHNCRCQCLHSCPSATPENRCTCSFCSLIPCPKGQTSNVNTCKCECSKKCPRGQLPDPNNNCICQCLNTCPSEQNPDPANNCTCEIPTTCPTGQILNELNECIPQCSQTCLPGQTVGADPSNKCSCHCNISCPNGHVADPFKNCQCLCPNTCPVGQSTNPNNRCVCECPNTCPVGQSPNLNNNCVCQCPNTCPVGQSPNPNDRCVCECPNTCPVGQSPNPNDRCVCECPNTCPVGQSPNPNNNCVCQCPNTCPVGQSPNPNDRCVCGCPNTCPVGQSPNPNNNCVCQCPNTCPVGQSPNPNDRCVCECPNTCPVGQSPNPNNNCVCECPNTCPVGQSPNPNNNCVCECPNTCPVGQSPNPNDRCVCECPNTCPVGQSPNPNDRCVCECPNTCPVGQSPNPNDRCVCECPNTCPVGQSPNPNNNCVCQCPNTCPVGQSPNPNDRCVCECPNTCPVGQSPNPNNNCVCECPNTCPVGQSPNPNDRCVCECPNTCPVGQSPNPNDRCVCECPNTCPVGQSPNPNDRCVCECPNTCPVGQSPNPNNNCVCQCPNTCPVGQSPNPNDRCVCECPNTCPVGQSPNPNDRCVCECPNTCPVGQSPNPNDRCVCECPNICPVGQSPNPNNNCVCQCPNTCPVGQSPNPNDRCVCECPNTCPVGQSPNPNDRCVCECPNTCPVGQSPNPNDRCVCECPNTCPVGQSPNPNNNCVCQCPNTCPVGQSPNPNDMCVCQCPNTCPVGQLPNPSNNCICECTKSICPQATTRQNQVTCECECLVAGLYFNSSSGACAATLNTRDLDCLRQCPPGARAVDECDCQCTDSRQRYNSRTNQCEMSSCLQTCPANALLNLDCSCTCPLGFNFDVTTRTCDPIETRGHCSGNEFSCDINQVALRDCNGRCYCSCSVGFAGSRCEIRLQAELCDDCSYDNGHYHAGVTGYCDLFVICVPTGGKKSKTRPTSFQPFIMSCAPGTYYITRPDGWKGCDHLNNGRCSSDRCETLSANARYADPSACQSYWQCGSHRRLASKECCAAGERFDPSSSSCVNDGSCRVTCGPNRTHGCLGDHNRNATGCPYDINPNNPNQFYYKVLPGSAFHCQPTFIMDLTVCHCVTGPNPRPYVCEASVDLNFEDNPMNNEDSVPRVLTTSGQAANFSGSDDITLKIFAGSGFWTEYFQISLRLLLSNTVTPGQRTAVVTNADCGIEESVSITFDNSNFYFKIYQLSSSQPVEIAVPYSGRAGQDGWYSLTLLYRRESQGIQFSGSVGSFTESYTGNIPLTSYIDYRPCALHIGQGFQYSGLIGLVDNFQVWRCDPRTSSHGQSG